ncbi:MAG: class I SAM-dependent rRNA methyltransferase [Planctomycetota bacterium]|jgi:23S rRNA (cytosine1962-C5)-methyltransferase
MGELHIRKGRAKPLWRGHPWVFADSVASVEGSPAAGDLVTVRAPDGRAIGCGFYSPDSAIVARILSGEERIETGTEFFAERLAAARDLRDQVLGLPVVTDGYRLVHSEGDLLPGLVVDQFAGHLAVQFSTVGMHRRREQILDALEEVMSPLSIHETPDAKANAHEGIETRAGLLRGEAPSEAITITENGIHFLLGVGGGQKTGFYADQRENRKHVARLFRDRRVLDLYCYTGGFGLYAAVNGAEEVLGVDSSGPALELAVENAALNNGRQMQFERADVREVLDRLHREKRRFDFVVCDPPRFARDRSHVDKALRAYRDVHLRAMRVVEPGGLLCVASCSGVVGDDAFEQTVREAAYDLRRTVRILHRGGQSSDHPVLATCPEGRYLKFLLLAVG